eukprot:scaffold23590_cov129-Isochrysis_galbana.AAC.3
MPPDASRAGAHAWLPRRRRRSRAERAVARATAGRRGPYPRSETGRGARRQAAGAAAPGTVRTGRAARAAGWTRMRPLTHSGCAPAAGGVPGAGEALPRGPGGGSSRRSGIRTRACRAGAADAALGSNPTVPPPRAEPRCALPGEAGWDPTPPRGPSAMHAAAWRRRSSVKLVHSPHPESPAGYRRSLGFGGWPQAGLEQRVRSRGEYKKAAFSVKRHAPSCSLMSFKNETKKVEPVLCGANKATAGGL